MKTDGSILIDTRIVDGGMEKGFELIKDEMASVGLTAKKVGEQIELSFSEIEVSKPIEDAFQKLQSLQKEFGNLDLKYQKESDISKKLEEELARTKSIINNTESQYISPDVYSEAYIRGKELSESAEKQKAVVSSLEKKWSSVRKSMEIAERQFTNAINKELQKQTKESEKASQRAIRAAEKEAAAKQRAADKQLKALTKSTRHFGTRMREIISGALFFNILSAGLRELTTYFGTALKANDEFATSFARLKGAFLTAFQPIYEFVLPALLSLMRILTAIMQVIGNFFAAITGKSSAQMAQNAKALNKQAGAIGGVGDAAEKASKQLAGFDEINRLESMESGSAGGGGGGSGSGEIAPNFEPMEITEDLEKILALVGSIAAGLLAWKIASMFTDSLSVAAGLGLAIGSALYYAYNWADAFTNGISWDNFEKILLSSIGVVAGLGLAFGTVGAAVGLLITGLGMVILALHEWITTGQLSNEACAALVTGIMAIGAALSLFTGNWIPALVAGIAAAVILVVKNWDKIKEASIAVWEHVKQTWSNVAEWFDANVIHPIVEFFTSMGESVLNIWDGIISWIVNAINDVVGFFNNVFGGGGSSSGGSYAASPSIAAYSVTPDVPHLARGAVLPANKPFLAMVGDQKHGTNIEAPLDTIKQAVAEVMTQRVSDDRVAQLLEILIATVEGIEVGDETIGKAAARYNRNTSRAGGW